MPKKVISLELEREIKSLYDDSIASGMLPRQILPKINTLLKKAGHGGYASEKSLYNLVNSFSLKDEEIIDVSKSTAQQLDKHVEKKLKNAINFDLNLSWQNDMTKEIASRMFNRFIAIDDKGDKANQKDLIEFARITKEYIDLGVKIDALNAKKIDVNNPENKTTLGILVQVNGSDASRRLEEVTASVIEAPQLISNNLLNEASYG